MKDTRITKEKTNRITSFKIIMKQKVDEKAQLQNWKTVLMIFLANKITQLHKVQKETIKAQYIKTNN